jgi:hypothetical protein
MGFFADLKAKRAAKRAQSVFDAELNDWNHEQEILTNALDIFTGAANGEKMQMDKEHGMVKLTNQPTFNLCRTQIIQYP